MNWIALTETQQLDKIVEDSFHKDILIFKHSTTCPISMAARMRLESPWTLELEKFDSYYLDLLKFRSVSNAVAEKFDVHHESPQIIIIRKGEAIYDNSHLDISIPDTEDILNQTVG